MSGNYNYLVTKTLSEALKMLSKKEKDTFPIAGGTDMLIQIRNDIISPRTLIDISNLKELNFIENNKEYLYIGGSVTFNEIIECDLLKQQSPLLIKASKLIGSPQIRNVATLAGNIQTASPAGDGLVALYGSDALVVLVSQEGQREIPIEKFIKGPGKTEKRIDEIIKGFKIPRQKWDFQEFFKVGKRNALAISIINGIVKVNFNEDGTIKDTRIVLGAVGPTPIRLERAENLLVGKNCTEKTIEEIKKIISEDISPISDIRGSSEYRRHIASVHCGKLIELSEGGKTNES